MVRSSLLHYRPLDGRDESDVRREVLSYAREVVGADELDRHDLDFAVVPVWWPTNEARTEGKTVPTLRMIGKPKAD
jgi:hypothetical protein